MKALIMTTFNRKTGESSDEEKEVDVIAEALRPQLELFSFTPKEFYDCIKDIEVRTKNLRNTGDGYHPFRIRKTRYAYLCILLAAATNNKTVNRDEDAEAFLEPIKEVVPKRFGKLGYSSWWNKYERDAVSDRIEFFELFREAAKQLSVADDTQKDN